MNRTKLKTYAPKARRDFLAAVTARAAKHGITKTEIKPVSIQGDIALIDGQPFPKKVALQRQRLEDQIKFRDFDPVMEEVAYTWFNRFAAIRFMEVHGYFDHGYRVLSHPDGQPAPEIIEHADHLNLPGLNRDRVIDLKLDGTRDEELYRMLIIAQCNALHAAMPFLFERIDDETELLLPDNLLHSDSPIRQMVAQIDEADWHEIEIIGWLYQFYISDKKDQVIGKVVRSEDIPAATQLFTPNWIVKYMVQNSLGAKWLSTYPSSNLRGTMKYYVNPAEQDPDTLANIEAITPRELNPEEITFLDPACGSGHILVEAYDLFKEIYLERGYVLREIPRLILEKNIHGLDIDDRAVQLACFALLMKARADDRRILERIPSVNIIAAPSPNEADLRLLYSTNPGHEEQVRLASLNSRFAGSLVTIPRLQCATSQEEAPDILAHRASATVHALVKFADLMNEEYDCVVFNPPYMSNKFFGSDLKHFANSFFKDGKNDLYGCFILKAMTLTKPGGYIAAITIPNWMFLSIFEELRKAIVDRSTIATLVHNGRGVFGSDFGTCMLVMRNTRIRNYTSRFFRLFDRQGTVSANDELADRFLRANPIDVKVEELKAIPGTPIAYWASESILRAFRSRPLLRETVPAKSGQNTGDNNRFTRRWHEVEFTNIKFDAKSLAETMAVTPKWFPYNKGGEFRQWYGNFDFVVNWSEDGKEIKNYAVQRNGGKHWSRYIQNLDYMLKEGITWTFISSSYFGARYTPPGHLFDYAGCSAFPQPKEIPVVLAFFCSTVCYHILQMLNPTLNLQPGNIGNLPMPLLAEDERTEIIAIASKVIDISKTNWDSRETSWGFQQSTLLSPDVSGSSLKERVHDSVLKLDHDFTSTKLLQEKNNEIFARSFGVQDIVRTRVLDEEVTLFRPTEIEHVKELISYAVGCIMGRYSLDEPGLIYAGREGIGFTPEKYSIFPADDDGILPIEEEEWFENDAANRVAGFLKAAWPEYSQRDNLRFIADLLGVKANETPLDTVRRYFSRDFFKDHLKAYKRRPIYWLFSSGKEKAFEALVYLHRYNEGTLSRMRMEYVTPLQGRIAARIEHLEHDVKAATSTAAQSKLRKELEVLKRKQAELSKFDDELRHHADMRISLNLDDGVKVNYGKFRNLLAEVKAVTGGSDE